MSLNWNEYQHPDIQKLYRIDDICKHYGWNKELMRKAWFGIHKGEYILELIADRSIFFADDGLQYIQWCLKNLSWFKLSNEEQKFYDDKTKKIFLGGSYTELCPGSSEGYIDKYGNRHESDRCEYRDYPGYGEDDFQRAISPFG